MIPEGWEVVETDERLDGPEFVSRFRWRAERRRVRLELQRVALRMPPSFRYEIVHEDGRHAVYAFQNVLRAVAPDP